jgi:hypothetical protein
MVTLTLAEPLLCTGLGLMLPVSAGPLWGSSSRKLTL